MLKKEQILELMEPGIDGDKCFLVDLNISTGNHISVEIDGIEGVNIAKCIEISRLIEHNLDRDEVDFSLDVSTPGLDKPFKIQQQYLKNIDKEVKVRLKNDEGTLKGVLKSVNEEGVVLETKEKVRTEGRKKKEWQITEHNIEYLRIEETKVVISFK